LQAQGMCQDALLLLAEQHYDGQLHSVCILPTA
jgi:hypothetical protein